MGILSPAFVGFAALAVLLFRLHRGERYRSALLTLLNAFFLWSYADDLWSLLPFALFVAQGYVLIRLVQARSSRGVLLGSVAAYVLLFVYLRRYAIVSGIPALPDPYLTVGLSYILFRVLHVMVDASGGLALERFGPLRYFNYTCGFLTFVSGPIQRYEDYEAQERAAAERGLDAAELHAGVARLTHGLFKLAVVEFFVRDAHARALQMVEAQLRHKTLEGVFPELLANGPLWGVAALAIFSYLLFLYVNFSGYMDVVIGYGRLMGFTLPENFDQPFKSKSFLELWSRWHITLSEWFKFYVFNPLVTALTRRWPNPAWMPYYGVLGFLLAFFVMGVWHGTSTLFLFYGLMLGLGVSVNKLYEVLLRKRLGKKRHRKLAKNPWYGALTNAMTLTYFALALTCFWRSWGQLKALARGLGVPGVLAVVLCLLLVFGAVMSALRLAERATAGINRERLYADGWHQRVYIGLKIFILILYFALADSDAPAFIYEEF